MGFHEIYVDLRAQQFAALAGRLTELAVLVERGNSSLYVQVLRDKVEDLASKLPLLENEDPDEHQFFVSSLYFPQHQSTRIPW